MWTCPACDRRFGKVNQHHDCAPGMSVEEYFDLGPESERPIFDAVLAHLRTLDPDVYFEPLAVGIFFKRRTSFLQLRTMTKWVAVCFTLDHKLTSNRVSRKVIEHSGRFFHVVNIGSADEIDGQLCDWLAQAWSLDE